MRISDDSYNLVLIAEVLFEGTGSSLLNFGQRNLNRTKEAEFCAPSVLGCTQSALRNLRTEGPSAVLSFCDLALQTLNGPFETQNSSLHTRLDQGLVFTEVAQK